MEYGIGHHGEPGLIVESLKSAKEIAAVLCEKIEADLKLKHGEEISVIVSGLGGTPATMIEKHFTLDKSAAGPDHAASLDPAELAAMVKAVRNVDSALGSRIKTPSPSEMKNIAVARKSIVAAKKIKKGETLTDSNLTAKRPGDGLSPMLWDMVVGTAAVRDFMPDDQIIL